MTFRQRLYAFFAIIVVAPAAAVAVVGLTASVGDRADEIDARLAQGFRTAFAVYDEARTGARPALRRVASDLELGRALRAGRFEAADERLELIIEREPAVRSIAGRDRSGRAVAEGGTPHALAAAAALERDAAGRPAGTLSVSTTGAGELAHRVARLTGLAVRLDRGGEPLASTLGRRAPPRASGDVAVGGRGYRARSARIQESAGPPVELSLFHPSNGAFGPFGESRLVFAGILIGLLLVLLGAAAAIVRSLQGQVRQLLAAARRLRQGDFSRRVTVTGDDPFALLGGEFNAMSEELASKVEEVERRRHELEETIRRVGDAFAAGLDREGIVDLAVRTAVEACSADAGRAVPIDAEKMREAHVGPGDHDLDAALEAAERRAFEVRSEDAGELLDQLEGGPRATVERRRATHVTIDGVSAVAVPLRARVGALSDFQYVGVVSIARRDGEFSPSERDLFAYLAGQAAVSIENAHLHERVQLQAVTDELTGLANVRQFHEKLAAEIERCRRFSTDVGLIMLDIDDFKAVNDTYGHQQGDLVLQEVARVLRGLSRDVDSPARYGGEEMVVVLPQTDLAGSEAVAERMRAAIATLSIRRIDSDGVISATASFGVAALPESASSESSLIAAADAALYRAKRAGKNRVERAEALTTTG